MFAAINQPQNTASTQIEAMNFQLIVGITILTTFVTTPVVANPGPGTIQGSLSYPSDVLPSLNVCAEHVWKNFLHCIKTNEEQRQYSIKVPPGTYYMFATPGERERPGLYSSAVPCGLNAACNDHGLLPVIVKAGQIVKGIDPTDWYY